MIRGWLKNLIHIVLLGLIDAVFAGLLLESGMVELMFPFVASFYVNSLIFRLCCYWAKIFKQCSSSFACVAQEKAKEGLKTYYIRILPGFASR